MKKIWLYVRVCLVLFLVLWLILSLLRIRELRRTEGIVVRDTITITRIDTIKESYPVYISQKVVDTIFIAIKDTLRVNDTLYQIVPKTQRKYAKKDSYEAWVSGYKPSLDSINVFNKTITETITNTIKTKPSRFGVGVMGGYGLGLSKTIKPTPFVGIGLYYRIW